MYKPTFKLIPGFSPVDHVGGELLRLVEAEVEGRVFETRAGAMSGGRAALRRVKRRLRDTREGVWQHMLPWIEVGAS